ncbi:MAG: DNA polymerase III subunit beta [Candidatus Paceibacterota bacterium]|jgi:DNA polymerase-3 subunit beta
MKFTILKENLSKGLNYVEKITGKNLVLPILNNVLLSAEKNILKLITTDLEVAIIHRCMAKIETEGEITIPVRVLNTFINLLDDQKIDFELKTKTLFVSGKNNKTQIKGLDSKDFPIIPKIEENEWIEINSAALCEGVSQVIDFSSITQARPELTGVYFLISGNQIKIVATDSFRLAEKTVNFVQASDKKPFEKSFIIPRNAAREIVNLFGGIGGNIKIYFSANQVMFESRFSEIDSPQSQLISRLIEGEFPNYQEIIPKEFKTQANVSQEQLQKSIKAAGIFGGRGNELILAVDSKKGQIDISAQDSEIGETSVSVAAKTTGDKTSVCFNHKFLLDGVMKTRGKDIFIGLNGEGGPGVIKSGSADDFLYILMPIKSI